jgi:hypothetical protein
MRDRMVFHRAFLLCLTESSDIPERVGQQLLVDCMHSDLSGVDLYDEAVTAFLDLIPKWPYSKFLTVQNLKSAIDALNFDSITRASQLHESANTLTNLLSRGVNLVHLNRILEYVGCRDLNKCYRASELSVRKFSPAPPNHHSPKFSLGLCVRRMHYDEAEGVDEDEVIIMRSRYRSSSAEEIFYQARVVLEPQLKKAMDFDTRPSWSGNETACNAICFILYMDDQEVIRVNFPNHSAFGAYIDLLDVESDLKNEVILLENAKFQKLLFSGQVFGGEESRVMRNLLKTRKLEAGLGM